MQKEVINPDTILWLLEIVIHLLKFINILVGVTQV